jgi:hypothetical protein
MSLGAYPALTFSHLRFTLQAQETLHLPPFKGSALRGGFGTIFKQAICVQPQTPHCGGCLLAATCAYAYLFETRPPADSAVLRTHEAVPHPFVIEPPDDSRADLPPGAELTFGLTLIGRAADFLPHFLVVFRQLGEAGLGRGRGRYVLRQVQAVHPLRGLEQPVYDGRTLLGAGLPITADEVADWAGQLPPDRLTVRFTTPARLKHEGVFVQEIPFHVLARALLRRLSSLAYFHCGGRWETDYAAWVEQAQRVETAAASLHWAEWKRFSGRQERRIEMGGVVGEATYSGSLAPFRPLLALGQWTHVGKGTVFGNGQYVVLG